MSTASENFDALTSAIDLHDNGDKRELRAELRARNREVEELHNAANTLFDIDRWTDDLAKYERVNVTPLRAAIAGVQAELLSAADNLGVQL
jgi:hypothetical protein